MYGRNKKMPGIGTNNPRPLKMRKKRMPGMAPPSTPGVRRMGGMRKPGSGGSRLMRRPTMGNVVRGPRKRRSY
tara:strand:+ start:944 stop:1162 length:219 start_codon:yes stop_codon:yes gene_type:complete